MLFQILPANFWGDYGEVLVHGIGDRLPRKGGRLQLERTGPFVPALTFPGVLAIVVTKELRACIERHNLAPRGQFIPLDLRRIVESDWLKWDRLLEYPPVPPKDGEPESYVLGRRHSPAAARLVSELFEFIPPESGEGHILSDPLGEWPFTRVRLRARKSKDPALFRFNGQLCVEGEKAKVLRPLCEPWVELFPIKMI